MITIKKTTLAGILVMVVAVGTAMADVYYHVGTGQTYATIQAAANALPNATFTENHIISIHADTAGGTKIYDHGTGTVDLNFNNNYLNRQPTPTCRLIIQAHPGDDVTLKFTATGQNVILARNSNVTFQGLKFTGKNTAVNQGYLGLGQYSSGNALRSGFLIYNCEFEGGAPAYGGLIGGTDASWTVAYVNNYIHDTDFHNLMFSCELAAGNVFSTQNPTTGGGQVASPSTLNTNAHFVNNTFVDAGVGVDFNNGVTNSQGVVANNILIGMRTRGCRYSMTITTAGHQFPTMSNNLCSNSVWASHGAGHAYATLAVWNTTLTAGGKATEINSKDRLDPLFVDASNRDYRPIGSGSPKSPAYQAGNAAAWSNGIAHISGLQALLDAYWNPKRDIKYARSGVHIGALQPTPIKGTCLGIY